jgi:hypothetical protein
LVRRQWVRIFWNKWFFGIFWVQRFLWDFWNFPSWTYFRNFRI